MKVLKNCSKAGCCEVVLAKGLCRHHYDIERTNKRKNDHDLLDKTSIALFLAGPNGLITKEVRQEVNCKQEISIMLCKQLVEMGYAKLVKVGVSHRYVHVKSYPSTDNSDIIGVTK